MLKLARRRPLGNERDAAYAHGKNDNKGGHDLPE
jgi:hypothetical protein